LNSATAKHWNNALRNTKIDFDLFKFDNFLKVC
jgi:hypothetical protein